MNRKEREVKPLLNEPTKVEQNEFIISLYEHLVDEIDSVFEKGKLTKHQKQTLTKMLIIYLGMRVNL